MRYLGVIGHPLKRSLSPVFQQTALDHLRLDILYESWPTPPEGLGTRLTGLRAPGVLGANVTIPHKEAVLPLTEELDDMVRRVGAVNTIVNHEGRLQGYNTDVDGFLRALKEDGDFNPAGKRVVVAGAGGAARAVVVALIDARAASVTVLNRTSSRARKLIDDLRPLPGDTELTSSPDDGASWAAALSRSELLINCTSLGSAGSPEGDISPTPAELIRPEMFVYDLVYDPLETPLLKAARESGAKVLGGLPMLIYQGAASFQLWTGREAPLDVMFEAAQTALAERTVAGEA